MSKESRADVDWQDTDFHCITCSDEAVEVCVISVDEGKAMAQVSIGESEGFVDVSLVDSVKPGDRLLAHGGVALANLRNGQPE